MRLQNFSWKCGIQKTAALAAAAAWSYPAYAWARFWVGFGVGELHQYLIDAGIPHHYSGSEMVGEMVEHASKKFPGTELFHRDILEAPSSESYDFLMVSGAFNLRGDAEPGQWKEGVEAVIAKIYSMSRCGIAFNALTSESEYFEEGLAYFDPKAMMDFCCNRLSRFVTLDQSYPLYEYTLTVLTPDFVQKCFSGDEYRKYFRKNEPR